jgi:acyl-CoA synthetase (AMP-forming)/AMP-acid ligase II
VGKIWIRSRTNMLGYWGAPSATEEVVIGGWLDSGDLARADADGYLWFFGRKKQVIVHDGSNISPYEVEGALVEHPAVSLAGAVGIHDEVHGENVRAYVTLRDGVEPPSRADLIVFCRERIRLQGARRGRLPRQDAAHSDRQDRSGRAQADGRRPPPPAQSELIARPPSERGRSPLLSPSVRIRFELARFRIAQQAIAALQAASRYSCTTRASLGGTYRAADWTPAPKSR